jgi:hypothetical protein
VINTAFVLEDRPLACFFAAPGETVTRTNALGSTPARRIRPAAAEGPRSLGPEPLVRPLIQPPAATAQEISWL